MTRPHGSHRTTTRVLRDAIDAQSGDDITLDTLLVPLRARAFGVMLLVFAIPNFIPVPIGIGGVMGVLTVLLGLQMLFGLEHPLVPAWLRRKSMHRTRVERFLERTSPITGWLERWCRPRLESLTRRPWSLLSGLALVILGVLLALPIPFTNYLFGVILLAFSFALLERDGALLLAMWMTAAVLLVLSFLFSHALLGLMHQVF
ncbi:MAG TPA: exopolysaccharide biosynthesis protein [Rhodanobacteraceae bacterium]|nr:exopolysaccharide biosynthesis protein [Rhodanobacteraceae bacterium]